VSNPVLERTTPRIPGGRHAPTGRGPRTATMAAIPAFLRAVAADALTGRPEPGHPRVHLAAAVGWLCRAHDAGGDGGVSYGYSLKGGWRPSYPEVSGYIAVTFFDLARRGDGDAGRRALAIAEWLCRTQNADGSIANPRFGRQGIVFDTGQVLSGLTRAFEETGEERFLAAAEKAADWLARTADADGLWRRHEHLGVMHVYNTRVAWPLLALTAWRPRPSWETVARANLDWALRQQRPGGFEHCGFADGDAPFTHTIAYTLRGLLESGALLGERRYVDAAVRGATAVLAHLGPDGYLPGRIDPAGRSRSRSACLTGNAQMATVWSRLFALTGEAAFREGASRSLRFVMACQDLATRDADRHGAIKGSHPIWGSYAPLTYPSWATKFFVDAILLTERSSP
jgi:squalene-hopene cyclase-like protein